MTNKNDIVKYRETRRWKCDDEFKLAEALDKIKNLCEFEDLKEFIYTGSDRELVVVTEFTREEND